jgi:tetratricopeptide (TPR) repeat protein
MYGEHGALQRAAIVRGMALGQDRPDIWAMTQDILTYHPDIAWPDPMRRATWVNLGERMVQGGDVNQAERVLTDAIAWASSKDDKAMVAWGGFAGSRLDFRRGDLYRARDRAKDALKAFEALEDKGKVAEVHNHLAMVEYQDGNPNAALDQVRLALEANNSPAVQANAFYVRGLVDRKAKKLPEAGENFRKANEIAGNAGIAQLALEAGFQYGETLVQSQQASKAADVLARVAQIAQALQNPQRERAAVALLAQAHGMLRNFEAALQMSNRALQLTQQLKFDRLLAVDIFNVGYFNLMLGRATEAVSLFAKAKERATADDPAFLRELHYHTGVANLRIGENGAAAASLKEAYGFAQRTRDARKVISSADGLATIAAAAGDKVNAGKWLEEAIKVAESANLREERKALRKKLDDLA